MSGGEDGFRSGFVLLWGRPNVGKSTLLNTILGRKVAIVTQKPQTTRNRIAGVLTKDSCQVVLVDTPGIHEPHDALGEYMVTTAREALPDADVRLMIVDASVPPGPGDEEAARLLVGAEAPSLLVLNKCDITPPEVLPERIEAYRRLGSFTGGMAISALTGEGVPELLERVEGLLPEGPMYYPPETVTDHPESFQVAELIREQALLRTQQEVPYSLAVVVEEITPRSEDMVYVRAVLYVEREGQKRILIGQRGSVLKEIGQSVRPEVEALLGKRVFLDLWVKVRERWRRDPLSLAAFGYPIPRQRRPKHGSGRGGAPRRSPE